jgi:hypothetical protein
MSLITPESGPSVDAGVMTDPDPNPFADCDVIVCYGGAKVTVTINKDRALPASSTAILSVGPSSSIVRRRPSYPLHLRPSPFWELVVAQLIVVSNLRETTNGTAETRPK